MASSAGPLVSPSFVVFLWGFVEQRTAGGDGRHTINTPDRAEPRRGGEKVEVSRLGGRRDPRGWLALVRWSRVCVDVCVCVRA